MLTVQASRLEFRIFIYMNLNESIGRYKVHFDAHELESKHGTIKLSPKEIGVLELLMSNVNTTVTRSEILARVWGDKFANDQGLTQVISRLRTIFSKERDVSIRTIPKKGYQLQQGIRSSRTPFLKLKPALTYALVLLLAGIIGYLIFFQPIGIRIRVKKVPAETVSMLQTSDQYRHS